MRRERDRERERERERETDRQTDRQTDRLNAYVEKQLFNNKKYYEFVRDLFCKGFTTCKLRLSI